MRPTSLLRTANGAARASTFALPASTPIQSAHLSALYQEQLRVAKQFDSYNFRHFFLRQARHKFHVELPRLLGASDALPDVPGEIASAKAKAEAGEAESIYKPSGGEGQVTREEVEAKLLSPEGRLRRWYDQTVEELAVISRAATINQMYQGPRLVVEPGHKPPPVKE